MSKNEKGINLIVFILIIILIIAIGATIVAIVINKNTKNNNVNNNTEANTSNSKWDNYEIIIDGVSIKLPITYKEFIQKGFYPEQTNSSNLDFDIASYKLKPKYRTGTYLSTMRYTTFTNGTTNNISLIVYNPTDESKAISESYVVGIELQDGGSLSETKIGNFKIINNTKNAEVIIGKSTISEIETLFGTHYQNDYLNEFSYYPDLKGDGEIGIDDLSITKGLKMFCDSETKILVPSEFMYLDFGNLEI